jgi:hypothetical protein
MWKLNAKKRGAATVLDGFFNVALTITGNLKGAWGVLAWGVTAILGLWWLRAFLDERHEVPETAAPLLTASYEIRNVWRAQEKNEWETPFTVRNAGNADAIRITIADINPSPLMRIEFPNCPIPEIRSQATIELRPSLYGATPDGALLLESAPFGKGLAGLVLGSKKKGHSWPVYMEYSDYNGARYFTRGEFRCDEALVPMRLYFQFVSNGILSEAPQPQ